MSLKQIRQEELRKEQLRMEEEKDLKFAQEMQAE